MDQLNKRLLELTQELSDAISSCRKYLSTPKPLNAYMPFSGANMTYPFINTIFEYYRKGMFKELTLKLSIIYEDGKRYYSVCKSVHSIFKDTVEELKFDSYGEALNQFNKWQK